jgi:hypothetical protein
MFAVVDNVECRNVLDTTINATPAVIVSIAARCRSSRIVIRETRPGRAGGESAPAGSVAATADRHRRDTRRLSIPKLGL